jgi:hypothetical protein
LNQRGYIMRTRGGCRTFDSSKTELAIVGPSPRTGRLTYFKLKYVTKGMEGILRRLFSLHNYITNIFGVRIPESDNTAPALAPEPKAQPVVYPKVLSRTVSRKGPEPTRGIIKGVRPAETSNYPTNYFSGSHVWSPEAVCSDKSKPATNLSKRAAGLQDTCDACFATLHSYLLYYKNFICKSLLKYNCQVSVDGSTGLVCKGLG